MRIVIKLSISVQLFKPFIARSCLNWKWFFCVNLLCIAPPQLWTEKITANFSLESLKSRFAYIRNKTAINIEWIISYRGWIGTLAKNRTRQLNCLLNIKQPNRWQHFKLKRSTWRQENFYSRVFFFSIFQTDFIRGSWAHIFDCHC